MPQKQKLNGPPETVNLNKTMTYEELKQVSLSLQFLYLDHLVTEHKARKVDLADMLGCSYKTVEILVRNLPGKLIFKRGAKQAPEWRAFIGTEPIAEEPAAEPETEPIAEETEGLTVGEPIPIHAEDITIPDPAEGIKKLQEMAEASAEKAFQASIPAPVSGSLLFHCTGPDLIAALIMHLPDLVGKTEEHDFTIIFQ